MTWDGGDPIKGRILKGIGGFYYIYGEDGAVYECRAKGKFRREGVKPMPVTLRNLPRLCRARAAAWTRFFPAKTSFRVL